MSQSPQVPLIEAVDVVKAFGPRQVLGGVSLRVFPGETVALIGPSGGGKSTLLRCLNGLAQFDAGAIRVGAHTLQPSPDGHERSRAETQAVRRLLGMVFQDFQLFPHLSALQNIIEGPTRVLGVSHSEAVERGARLLEQVGLADRGGAYPQQLSGGQKQRVAIARALAMQPKGLLCDEITSALDPELKHEVLEVVAELRREGMTLVMVTHEIGFARRAADRVVVLADGTIVEEGPPEQVLEAPRSTRTQKFLQHVLA